MAFCKCGVGTQFCEWHPEKTRTTLERILFEKEWDKRVAEGKA